MYDPHAKDLKERERLRKIWEPLPSGSGPSTFKSETSTSSNISKEYTSSEYNLDYLRINGTDRVSPSNDNSDKMVDFWMLPNEQATSSGSLSDTSTPFSWHYDNWSPHDTDDVGCQDQNILPLEQYGLKKDTTSASPSDTSTSFSSHNDSWSPHDTDNVGFQGEKHLPLMQRGLKKEATSDSLSTLMKDPHMPNNGSTTVTTSDVLSQADSNTSQSKDTEVTEKKPNWLTDSIAFIRCNPFYTLECALKEEYLALKLENIPWAVSVDDIKKEFKGYIQPLTAELDQNIHIMMDISSGKTDSKAFLQIVNCDYNRKLLENDTKNHIIHCRRIKLSICTQDEFLRTLYPSWTGTFKDGKAILPANKDDHPVFVTQRELQSLGIVCKDYKLHFNRKSGERPFKFMKTLILNLPWHQGHTITTSQRDIIYESYKIMAKYLVDHSKKQNTPFEADAASKFVRPALQCCGFTPKQRRSILHKANVSCPPELAYSIQDPVQPQDTTE